ncbi:MAG: SprT family zinc-dependent metalloprotease [Candidatus Nitrotoga sp.]|nr:SprT family zinc-dependent metalloprotease [Candidatus Nitrotoga sp.]
MLDKLRRFITPLAVEQRTVDLVGTQVTYTLKRTSRRRSIGLRIDNHGLTVNMPLRASEKWLHDVLQDKAHWVVKKLENWQARKPIAPQWRDGQSLFFIGEVLTLRVVVSLFATPPLLNGAQLFVHVTDDTNQALIEQTVTQWYQREAKSLFKECVAHYAPLMNVTPRMVKLSSARTQWGSCTTRGDVRLNWQLIKMPLHLIDYVVVHELAHLIEMNHSAAFWQVVEIACSDYAKRRRELKQWQISSSWQAEN